MPETIKHSPYWWEATPRPNLGAEALPNAVDVAIIGSGYTGLNAAIETARAGRSTLVLDAEDAGFGCSTRNGGQIGTSIKPSLGALSARYGVDTARGILSEGQNALAWIEDFVSYEGIDCAFEVCGLFHAAHSQRAFEGLVKDVADQKLGLEMPYEIVSRAEQQSEIGTERYHGGIVFPRHASLDPGRYHQGLLRVAMEAGAQVVAQCRAHAIEKRGKGYLVQTAKGVVAARDVVIATNGYTSGLTPWLQRRVIPIGSYIIATDPLAPEVMARLMPRGRTVSDTRRVVYYYRPSPDGQRILFGGRVSATETDTAQSARRLKRDLDALFPELKSTGISHSWMGFVAYTFDTLAHVGRHDGLYYAMGYCGSGVSMASYLGMRIGQQVVGRAEGATAFDGLAMPTRPLYSGKPWFLPAAVNWYRLLDRMGV